LTALDRSGGRLVSRALGLALFAALAAFTVLAVRRAPPETLTRLREARPLLLAAGFVAYGAAFFIRGARLNFLLPPDERLSGPRAGSLSAAALFLVQVLPFRGGELASWALYRVALGVGWVRSGAVFAVVKFVDSGVLILAGLSGAALFGLRGRATGLGAAAAVAAATGAAGLLLAPRLAGRGADRLARRFPEGSRRQRLAVEIGAALRVAHEQPRRYFASIAAAAACLAVQLGALWLMLRGLRVAASPGVVALALFSAAVVSVAVPSPAGNFGPSESGFTAALLLEGVPLPLGLVAAGLIHLFSTLAAGLVGLPFLIAARRTRTPRP
jgi:uncharacterized membrane protein YbhN (UPF0104 family)